MSGGGRPAFTQARAWVDRPSLQFDYRGLVQTVAPVTEPLGVDELGRHIRAVPGTEAEIEAYLIAAREYIEEVTGRQFSPATWQATYQRFPDWEVVLPRPPLLSVVSVAYRSPSDGSLVTLADTAYQAATTGFYGRLTPARTTLWPEVDLQSIEPVVITFRAGYEVMPARIKQAIRLLTAHSYEHRQIVNVGNIVTEIPQGLKMLIRSITVGGVR